MNGRTVVVLSAVAILALVAGTHGYDSMRADRDVSVTVAGSDEAYVEHAVHESRGRVGEQMVLLDLENQLSETPLRVVAVELDAGAPVEYVPAASDGRLDPDGHLTVECTTESVWKTTVEVVVSGEDVQVEFTRTVRITCQE